MISAITFSEISAYGAQDLVQFLQISICIFAFREKSREFPTEDKSRLRVPWQQLLGNHLENANI